MTDIPRIGVDKVGIKNEKIKIETVRTYVLNAPSINTPNVPVVLNVGMPVIDIPGCVESRKSSKENDNLVSNDPDGNVFVATELGISILETSFAIDESPSNISVSPNPFKIGQDNKIIFTNIPKESTVKIMNLSGLIVKEFYISNEDRIINWDGVSKYGKYLSSQN